MTPVSRSDCRTSRTYKYCICTGFKFILLWLLPQHAAWDCDSHSESWLSCDIECPSHFVHTDLELLLNSHWNDCTVPPNSKHQITLPKSIHFPICANSLSGKSLFRWYSPLLDVGLHYCHLLCVTITRLPF